MSEKDFSEVRDAELDRRLDEARKKPISQEVLDEFSKGEVRVTNRVTIEGEGDQRKLHIRIKWNDPDVKLRNNDAPIRLIESSRALDNPESKKRSIDLSLSLMVLKKEMFQDDVFHAYVFQPLGKMSDDILGKYRKIEKEGSEKTEKQKKQLLSQLKAIGNLREYTQYLKDHNAVAITIEEKPGRFQRFTNTLIRR